MWVPIGGNMFFRKEVFDTYGGFRTDLGPKGKIYGSYEDCEFCFRLKRKGEKLLYYPKAIIYHHVPQSKISKEYFQKYFWKDGLTRARIEDFPSKNTRYIKIILYLILKIFKRLAIYLLSIVRHAPSVTFYHKCQLYHLSARVYQYILKINHGIRN